MRISDWSSDVCSSDLRGRDVLTKTDQFGHLVRRYEIDECLVALEQFRGVADRVDHVECNRCAALAPRKRTQVLEKIAKPDAKIGRASGRERVCQYVSISVVAVSLKKTTYYESSQTYENNKEQIRRTKK